MALASLVFAASAVSAQDQQDRAPKVEIELIAERSGVRPGDEITVALRETITPGWHTYWINPGDSGEPTRIDWSLPAGASAGPIEWPLPEAIRVGPLMNFGYSNEVLLLSRIKVPETFSGSSFDIAADARWLVCAEICIPEQGSAKLSLPILEGAMTPLPSPNAEAIRKARQSVPEPKPWPAEFDVQGDRVLLEIRGAAETLPANADFRFFPLQWGQISHPAPQRASYSDGTLTMQLERGDFSAEKPPEALDGVIAVETRNTDGTIERRGYSISAAPADLPDMAPPAISSAPPTASGTGGLSLLIAIGSAFLGGLILNLMPCVFPVLSLKALSLAKDAGDASARRTKGFVYLAGVLASFALIAILVLIFRMSGTAIGWGMQFQSPAFVLAMMALFMGLGLNLSGVFSIGSGIAGIGDSLTRQSGLSGYFFTGVLATIVATPCTAPFMGAAMGFAFTQPAATVFAVLLALGLGFGLPIVLLSLSPALGRLLPRPGPWMETFKQVMAFPLYATVGWLLWVLSVQQGSNGVLAGVLTLVGIAFAAWLFGRSANISAVRNAAAALIALLSLGIGFWSIAGLPAEPRGNASAAADSQGPSAEPYSEARLAQLISENKPVFVNLTAAWCITCKVNERVALSSERLAEAFRDRNITYLIGDWTNGDPEITELLKAHGRVGVPLYLLYSGIPGEKPQILPQLLTESIVLSRLADLKSSPVQQAKGDF